MIAPNLTSAWRRAYFSTHGSRPSLVGYVFSTFTLEVPRLSFLSTHHFSTLSMDARRRRCVFRAGQRGWLELDVLLGSWTRQHIWHLCENEIKALETILEEETPRLYRYLTKQEKIPDHLRENPVLKALISDRGASTVSLPSTTVAHHASPDSQSPNMSGT